MGSVEGCVAIQYVIDSHRAICRLTSQLTAATVQAFLMPPLRGVVFETFGTGNAPQRKDLMSAIHEACERGVVIVAIAQCERLGLQRLRDRPHAPPSESGSGCGNMMPEVRIS
jgi:lysophospholipase